MNYKITYTDYQKQIIDVSLNLLKTLKTGTKEDILLNINDLFLKRNDKHTNKIEFMEISIDNLWEIEKGTDVYARLLIGQFDEVAFYCSLIGRDFEIRNELIELKKKCFPNFVYLQSYGIFNQEVIEPARVGYEISSCIKYFFNKNNEHAWVNKSLPYQISSQPFITINSVE